LVENQPIGPGRNSTKCPVSSFGRKSTRIVHFDQSIWVDVRPTRQIRQGCHPIAYPVLDQSQFFIVMYRYIPKYTLVTYTEPYVKSKEKTTPRGQMSAQQGGRGRAGWMNGHLDREDQHLQPEGWSCATCQFTFSFRVHTNHPYCCRKGRNARRRY